MFLLLRAKETGFTDAQDSVVGWVLRRWRCCCRRRCRRCRIDRDRRSPAVNGAWVVYALLFAAPACCRPASGPPSHCSWVTPSSSPPPGRGKALIAELAPQAQLGTAFGGSIWSSRRDAAASALFGGSGATPDRPQFYGQRLQRRSLPDCCCEPGEPTADAGAPAMDRRPSCRQATDFLATMPIQFGLRRRIGNKSIIEKQ